MTIKVLRLSNQESLMTNLSLETHSLSCSMLL